MFSRTLSSWGRLLGLGRASAMEEDRRTWGRLDCDVETSCSAARPGMSERLTVQVKNVSPGGILLLASTAFRPGQLLSLAIPHAEHEAASEVLACVVRCDQRRDGRLELGCTFATPLSEAELLGFR